MASTYPSMAVHVPAQSIPEELLTVEQAYELLDIGCKNGKALMGASRHGWLAGAVQRIADKYEVKDLGFLYCKPWEAPKGCCAFLLKGENIDGVIEGLSLMLGRAKTEPEIFAELLEDCDAEDVLSDLQTATASLTPRVDDGCAPNYLFAYLKSLKWFCESAREAGCAVLYAQWNGG
jgi:hypothetical protein